MTDPNPLPRLYDEKEVGKLLKRATELQQAEPSRGAGGAGLSLAELEEIAAEAGIDPHFLRRAAAELTSGSADPIGWEKLTGGPLTLVESAVVPGELDQDGFEAVVAAIQNTAHEHGQPSLLGRTLTWQAETAGKSRTMQVTVSARNGETHIRAEERLHQMATGLFTGTTIGVGTGVGVGVGVPLALNVFGSALLAVAFPLSLVGMTFMGCREIYRVILRRRRAALSGLVGNVVAAAAGSIAQKALSAPDRERDLPRVQGTQGTSDSHPSA